MPLNKPLQLQHLNFNIKPLNNNGGRFPNLNLTGTYSLDKELTRHKLKKVVDQKTHQIKEKAGLAGEALGRLLK
jgi:hypothetical protein